MAWSNRVVRAAAVGGAVLGGAASAAWGQLSFTTETLVEDGWFNGQSTAGIDAAGVPHVAYSSQLHTDSTTKEIWYATKAHGGAWSRQRLTLNSVRDESPSLAVDAAGKVHIAWHTGSPSINRLRYIDNVGAAFPGDEGGIVELATNPQAGAGFITPKIGVDAAGTVHAVFMNQGAANVDVFYLSRTAAGVVTGPINLTSTATNEQEPNIFVEPNGDVHITYRYPLSGNTQVGYFRSTGPGVFEAVPTFITPFTGASPIPLVKPTGELSVIYRQTDILRLVNANPDGSWANPPTVIDLSPANRPAFYDRFAVGADGRRYVAFAANVTADEGTWVRRESATPNVFEDAINLNTIHPERTNQGTSIAVNADGDVVVSWQLSWFDSVAQRSVSDIYVSMHTEGGAGCAADFNGLNGATVQDIYDFLADWSSQIGAGPVIIASADFNNAGGVTVQDIYDFLAAWSAGCP